MIDFKYKGIEIEIQNKPELHEYSVPDKTRIGIIKNVCVSVKFWDFAIKDGDLYELAFVKSVCSYFMHGYWKRSSREGNKINLDETLTHVIAGEEYATSTLRFNARQRNKICSLYICHENDKEKVGEVYLSGREVIMLDMAIAKAINMLLPTNVPLAKNAPVFGNTNLTQ